jgi:hypothetical protein
VSFLERKIYGNARSQTLGSKSLKDLAPDMLNDQAKISPVIKDAKILSLKVFRRS